MYDQSGQYRKQGGTGGMPAADVDLLEANRDGPLRITASRPGLATEAWSATFFELTLGSAWGDWDGDGDLDLALANDVQIFAGFVGGTEVWSNHEGNLRRAWASPHGALHVNVDTV